MENEPDRIEHGKAVELEYRLNELLGIEGFHSADSLESHARSCTVAALVSSLFDDEAKAVNAYWATLFFLAEPGETPHLVDKFLKQFHSAKKGLL